MVVGIPFRNKTSTMFIGEWVARGIESIATRLHNVSLINGDVLDAKGTVEGYTLGRVSCLQNRLWLAWRWRLGWRQRLQLGIDNGFHVGL